MVILLSVDCIRHRMGYLTRNHRWFVGLIFVLCGMTACATREAKVSDAAFEPNLPEVSKITFKGNNQFYRWSLLKVMTTQPRPFLQPWKRGEPYNSATLDADMLRLRKYYFDHGFLNATARVADIQEDAAANSVEIEIALEEGSPTRVKSVRLEGDWSVAPLTKQNILAELPLRVGHRLNKEDFDNSKSSLLRIVQEAGYARARVIPNTEIDSNNNEANITFSLNLGGLTNFGEMTIAGAKIVPKYVIRRQLDLREGQTYSPKRLGENQRSVYDLGMFNSVTPRALNLDQANAPLNVKIEVNERTPRTGRLGIGASSVESMRYEAEWVHRNLFGEAERLSLLARLSGIQQGLEAELREPYFMNRNNSLVHKLFVLNNKRIETDPFGIIESAFDIVDPQPAYDLLTIGGESRLNHRFPGRLKGALGLELTNNDFYNVDLTKDEEVESATVEDNILFVQFGQLEWNGRDDDLNPTRGELLSAQLDHSSKTLLSDVNFAKVILEGRYYLPLFNRVVLATRLKLGAIEPYGDSRDIPVNVRLYAGGPGSVRGFELNRLGPLDAEGNPIGGNSLLEGSVELRVPLIGDFTGALFVDFGNVFTPSFTYRLDDLRYAAGPGIRYVTPVGPLRFDLGFIIDRRDTEDASRFEFSIGQAF